MHKTKHHIKNMYILFSKMYDIKIFKMNSAPLKKNQHVNSFQNRKNITRFMQKNIVTKIVQIINVLKMQIQKTIVKMYTCLMQNHTIKKTNINQTFIHNCEKCSLLIILY